MERNRIRTSAELLPNLVLHVLACAGVGFNEEYGKQFQKTLTAEEISRIREMAEGFQAEAPAIAGPLFQTLFQIPCYFPGKSAEEIATIYDLTKRAVAENSFAPFEQYYPQEVELIYKYIPRRLESFLFREGKSISQNLGEALKLFSEIVQVVYKRFCADHWPEAKKQMEKIEKEILGRIGAVDLVKEWEMTTGLEFPYPRFHILLSEPTRFLGTSLLAEKVVFSTNFSVDIITEMIIHEVGTHIIWQAEFFTDERVREIMMKDYNGLARVMEAACQALRRPILERAGLTQQVDVVAQIQLESEFQVFNKTWKESQDIIKVLVTAYTEIRKGS